LQKETSQSPAFIGALLHGKILFDAGVITGGDVVKSFWRYLFIGYLEIDWRVSVFITRCAVIPVRVSYTAPACQKAGSL
jgi:hypothetical protein